MDCPYQTAQGIKEEKSDCPVAQPLVQLSWPQPVDSAPSPQAATQALHLCVIITLSTPNALCVSGSMSIPGLSHWVPVPPFGPSTFSAKFSQVEGRS